MRTEAIFPKNQGTWSGACLLEDDHFWDFEILFSCCPSNRKIYDGFSDSENTSFLFSEFPYSRTWDHKSEWSHLAMTLYKPTYFREFLAEILNTNKSDDDFRGKILFLS